MFLHAMTRDERLAFIGLAKTIIEADGVTHEAEVNLLSAIALEAGTRAETVPRRAIDTTLRDVFSTKRSQRAVMLELLGIAYSDGELHERESLLINEIARQFRLTEDDVLWMENWVSRQIQLAADAERFLSQEGI